MCLHYGKQVRRYSRHSLQVQVKLAQKATIVRYVAIIDKLDSLIFMCLRCRFGWAAVMIDQAKSGSQTLEDDEAATACNHRIP